MRQTRDTVARMQHRVVTLGRGVRDLVHRNELCALGALEEQPVAPLERRVARRLRGASRRAALPDPAQRLGKARRIDRLEHPRVRSSGGFQLDARLSEQRQHLLEFQGASGNLQVMPGAGERSLAVHPNPVGRAGAQIVFTTSQPGPLDIAI